MFAEANESLKLWENKIECHKIHAKYFVMIYPEERKTILASFWAQQNLSEQNSLHKCDEFSAPDIYFLMKIELNREFNIDRISFLI